MTEDKLSKIYNVALIGGMLSIWLSGMFFIGDTRNSFEIWAVCFIVAIVTYGWTPNKIYKHLYKKYINER